MTNLTSRRARGLVLLLPVCGLLQGCVAWEIRDGIRESNSTVAESNRKVGEASAQIELARGQIAGASAEITRASVGIEMANTRIEAANARIETVENQIETTETRIESTERRIESMEGVVENRMAQLNRVVDDIQPKLEKLYPITTSLSHLDAHLRSVRKTIVSLNDQMPFFELDADPLDSVPPPVTETGVPPEGGITSSGEPLTPPPAPGAAPEGAGAAAEGAGAPGAAPAGAAAESAKPKRELLLGTWLREHPSVGVALIFLEDGVYILDANGPNSERGTWKRDGESVVLTPTTMAPAPPPQPGQPAQQPTARPERRYKILGRAVRVLTLDGEGGVLVFSRP